MTDSMDSPLAHLAKLVGEAQQDGPTVETEPRDELWDIRTAIEMERTVELQVKASVEAARACGVSWQNIGEAFGVSRQGAFKRFGNPNATQILGDHMSKPVINLEERTEAVFRMLSKNDYTGVKELMTFTCSRVLTKKKVMGVWEHVVGTTGVLESLSGTVTQTSDGRNIILQQINQLLSGGLVGQTQLNHEAGEWLGRVAYNGSGKITGILIAHPSDTHNLPF